MDNASSGVWIILQIPMFLSKLTANGALPANPVTNLRTKNRLPFPSIAHSEFDMINKMWPQFSTVERP